MDMTFSISTSKLQFKPENVTLSDPGCHVDTSPSHLRGRTRLNACGTSLRLTNDSLIFSNFLLFPPAADSANDSQASITERIIPIQCRYSRVSELHLNYLPMVRHILFTETGVGQFQFRIQQFRDVTFLSKVADSAYPVRMKSSETVYIQLSLGEWVLEGEGQYDMTVETCVASPSASLMATHNDSSQELIHNSCPANRDVQVIDNQSQNATQNESVPHHHFRFSFRPIVFPDASDSGKAAPVGLVYIHCRVRLCWAADCPSPTQCPPPAPSVGGGRSKREATEIGQRRFEGRHLSTGPLFISRDTGEASSSKDSADPVVVALGAVAGMATLIAVAVVVAWALTHKSEGRYDITTSPN